MARKRVVHDSGLVTYEGEDDTKTEPGPSGPKRLTDNEVSVDPIIGTVGGKHIHSSGFSTEVKDVNDGAAASRQDDGADKEKTDSEGGEGTSIQRKRTSR